MAMIYVRKSVTARLQMRLCAVNTQVNTRTAGWHQGIKMRNLAVETKPAVDVMSGETRSLMTQTTLERISAFVTLGRKNDLQGT